MAHDAGAFDITFEAGQDLTDKKYHFVKLDENDQIVVCGKNEISIGILQNEPKTIGKATRVRLLGTSKMIMAEACNGGALLTPTAAGIAAVSAVGDTCSGAISLESADSADEIITVLVTHISTFLV